MILKELVVQTALMAVVVAAGTLSARAQSDKVDTDHDRILIWNALPPSNQQPVLVILGRNNLGNAPNAQDLRKNKVLIFNQLTDKSAK